MPNFYLLPSKNMLIIMPQDERVKRIVNERVETDAHETRVSPPGLECTNQQLESGKRLNVPENTMR